MQNKHQPNNASKSVGRDRSFQLIGLLLASVVLIGAILMRQAAYIGTGSGSFQQNQKSSKDDFSKDQCRHQILQYQQVLSKLEEKLSETLRSKMEALEDRVQLLQENRETEEKLVHTLATIAAIQDENSLKKRIIDEQSKEIEILREEAKILRALVDN